VVTEIPTLPRRPRDGVGIEPHVWHRQ
jgi:hypothetical protein